MQRQRTKYRADRGSRAHNDIIKIEASIQALAADDLLDLHDIFRRSPETPLARMTAVEVRIRDLDD